VTSQRVGGAVSASAHPVPLPAVAGWGLLALAWLASTAGLRPLGLPDEGRYVGVAYEMLRSGDWLTPTLDGLPFFHKPPLFYWITAASLALFGHHEWAARAAPLLGAAAGTLALLWFAWRWSGRRVAHLALLALLVQPLAYLGAQYANLDMLVAGCIAVAITMAADAVLSEEAGAPRRWPLALAWAAMGLGLLAKGLIGVVIPALVMAVALAASGRLRQLRTLLWWPGVVLMLVVAAPWFVAMQARHPGFGHYFFVVQHFQRYAAGGFNNVQPWWFFPALLLAFFLPWLPWLWQATSTRVGDGNARARFVRTLMWSWVAVVVLFFSLPRSKLVGYVLPVVWPLAWLAASGYARAAGPARGRHALWAGAWLLGAALGIGVVGWIVWHPQKSTRMLALALKERMAPGDRVYMLARYDFDVPFYARLREPVFVVDEWSDPALRRGDTWRRELLDAADFASPHAARVLLPREGFAAALCRPGRSWVIGDSAGLAAAWLPQAAQAVASRAGITLWQIDSAAMPSLRPCPETPSGDWPRTSAPPRPAAPAPAIRDSRGSHAAAAAHTPPG